MKGDFPSNKTMFEFIELSALEKSVKFVKIRSSHESKVDMPCALIGAEDVDAEYNNLT